MCDDRKGLVKGKVEVKVIRRKEGGTTRYRRERGRTRREGWGPRGS